MSELETVKNVLRCETTNNPCGYDAFQNAKRKTNDLCYCDTCVKWWNLLTESKVSRI
ncbi:MAG: hypothetical protein JKY33_10635 [Bacteroidia bacterium]|nr:hypothetical protein [Bacteroidia bacterium]